MPRVIRFHQFGPPDVLKVEDEPVREPGAGEVRIRVEAIGVSWNDALWRQDMAPLHARLPSGLGNELAGIIDAIGPDVTAFAVGDRVASFPGGHDVNTYPAYGEQMCMPVGSVARYPANLTPEEACVHYRGALIGYFAYNYLATLRPGQNVLITNACHCSGPATLQLAHQMGARVFATTDDGDDREYLLSLGAEKVIVTEEEDIVGRVQRLTDGHGMDVVLDACGGPQMGLLGDVMAQRGKLILYGLMGGNQTPFPACAAFEKSLKFFVHCLHDFTGLTEMGIPRNEPAMREALTYIDQLTTDRLFRTDIDRTFRFEEVVEAHRYQESGPKRGRVVLKV
ncbi:zinc-dependent alcohol dehydrogenase family protein [Pseudomonas sp. Marseille-QA0892]